MDVGQQLGPYEYKVEPHVVESFRAAVGDYEDLSCAPPALLTVPFLQLVGSGPGVIHAAQEFEFLAPLRVGAVLTLAGKVAAEEERRGRRYFTVEAVAVDDTGVEVARSRTVGLLPS